MNPIAPASLLPLSNIDYLFSATVNSQDQIDALAGTMLAKGIDLYVRQNYSAAAQAFKAVIALSPSSGNASNAFEYLGMAYGQQNDTKSAIKTYKDAIRVFPEGDNFHLKLGDIYFKDGQLSDASSEYELAVRLNPNSPDNRYSLGQSLLAQNRYREAHQQFTKVTQLVPTSFTGYFGLGQLLRKTGEYSDAVVALNKAIRLDKNAVKADLELGYVYADMGNMDEAEAQVDALKAKRSSLSATLQSYINAAAAPRISLVYGGNSYSSFSGPGTLLADIDSALSSPQATTEFTLSFVFSKDMDISSVQDTQKWEISRQSGMLISDKYDFGMPVPSTEVNLPLVPTKIVYDPKTRTAEVTFSISQNGTGDGTIDPSHIAFRFKGIDAYGKAMDPSADEYSGFSNIA